MTDAGEVADEEGDLDLEDEDEYVDEADEASDTETGGGTGTKTPRAQRAKKVPRGSLESAAALTTTMWGTAGSGSESAEAIARLFGHETTNSGSFRNKLALMRIWGLVEGSDSLKLTDIGLDIIRDDDPSRQMAARRRAFSKPKAFKKLLEAYDGRELPPENDLATKCRFDFNLTEEAALDVARVFAASLPYAGLMDENGIVHKDGVPASSDLDSDQTQELDDLRDDEAGSSRGGEQPRAAGEGVTIKPDPTHQTGDVGLAAGEGGSSQVEGTIEDEDAGVASTRAVEIKVTLTGYSGAEVVDILRTVGYRNAHG